MGKNPSMFEKWCVNRFGVVLYCLFVRLANSSAVNRPRIVTVSAASLIRGGIDMTGVLEGKIFEVNNKPAMMLPHASRFKGFITAGLFSLIGERELNRGKLRRLKNTTRRL